MATRKSAARKKSASRKKGSARAAAANATSVARVTKAVHLAAARALRKQNLPAQLVALKPGAGGAMKMMSGKISPPVQPTCYVAVIIPVYDKISPPVQP